MTPGGSAVALRRLLLVGAALGLFVSLCPPADAHDSPQHVIDALTVRIHAQPKRAELWWQRATEHRVLGDLMAAARDLREAIKLNPAFLAALTDLSRVQLAQGSPHAATRTIQRALAQTATEAERAPLRMVKADILVQSREFERALAECESALPYVPAGEPEWYLTRSQIQCRLGRYREAAAGLQEGFERTGSAVLEVECIEALIDGGLFTSAAARIEPLLENCRWRSSWLIRRARCRLGQGDFGPAHQDLLAAIQELNQRLTSPHPSPELLADRSLAYALAGDNELARRDLAQASKLGLDEVMTRRVRLALARDGSLHGPGR